MGADLDFYVESLDADGTWVARRRGGTARDDDFDWHVERDGILFAQLCDYCNGVWTTEPIVPLKEPEGRMPDGASFLIRGMCAFYRYEMNSASNISYATLAELLAYDTSRTATLDTGETKTYHDFCHEFWGGVINEMRMLGDPGEVRAIYWLSH